MGYSEAWGTLIHEKSRSRKSHVRFLLTKLHVLVEHIFTDLDRIAKLVLKYLGPPA
jgi:hypothetical protein